MKLKRCPNLNYYDGDKYDKCPCAKCAAQAAADAKSIPTPQPESKPVHKPETAPEEKAETKPETAPEEKVETKPETAPEEKVETKPETAPEEKVETKPETIPEEKTEMSNKSSNSGTVWRCNCGAVNSGGFCSECGSPKPQPEKKEEKKEESSLIWKCTCGAENKGKFCSECGATKPQPEKKEEKKEEPSPIWKCNCGAENKGNFCFECGMPKPSSNNAAEKSPAPAPQPTPESSEQKSATESLTQQINESKFTGTMEDAKKNISDINDGPGTIVLFDELEDDFVLAWLVVTNTSSKGKIFTINSPKSTIGRASPELPVDIDLHNDRGVSRGVQAIFVYDPLNKKFFLQSSGGKTYVYVNGEMLLTYKELNAYDKIRLGDTNLVFVPLCSEKFSW